jgi:hypothetical protein
VLFLGLYHLLWARGWLIRRESPVYDQPWLHFGAMVALGGAILMIFFGPLMTDAGRAEIETLRETGRVTYSADVLAFASPSIFGPLADGLVPTMRGMCWAQTRRRVRPTWAWWGWCWS